MKQIYVNVLVGTYRFHKLFHSTMNCSRDQVHVILAQARLPTARVLRFKSAIDRGPFEGKKNHFFYKMPFLRKSANISLTRKFSQIIEVKFNSFSSDLSPPIHHYLILISNNPPMISYEQQHKLPSLKNVPFLFTNLFQKRGLYSRGDIIQGRTLFKEIRYMFNIQFFMGKMKKIRKQD